jgi:hypothetical protein
LFATVSCECTKKAKVPVMLLGASRLPIEDEADGSGDELDMMNRVLSSQETGE